MVDKQVHLIEGQTGCFFLGGQKDYPFRGINMLSFWGDKQGNLFEGQSGCPFWGTNRLTFWGDKQVDLFEGHSGCPF